MKEAHVARKEATTTVNGVATVNSRSDENREGLAQSVSSYQITFNKKWSDFQPNPALMASQANTTEISFMSKIVYLRSSGEKANLLCGGLSSPRCCLLFWSQRIPEPRGKFSVSELSRGCQGERRIRRANGRISSAKTISKVQPISVVFHLT